MQCKWFCVTRAHTAQELSCRMFPLLLAMFGICHERIIRCLAFLQQWMCVHVSRSLVILIARCMAATTSVSAGFHIRTMYQCSTHGEVERYLQPSVFVKIAASACVFWFSSKDMFLYCLFQISSVLLGLVAVVLRNSSMQQALWHCAAFLRFRFSKLMPSMCSFPNKCVASAGSHIWTHLCRAMPVCLAIYCHLLITDGSSVIVFVTVFFLQPLKSCANWFRDYLIGYYLLELLYWIR